MTSLLVLFQFKEKKNAPYQENLKWITSMPHKKFQSTLKITSFYKELLFLWNFKFYIIWCKNIRNVVSINELPNATEKLFFHSFTGWPVVLMIVFFLSLFLCFILSCFRLYFKVKKRVLPNIPEPTYYNKSFVSVLHTIPVTISWMLYANSQHEGTDVGIFTLLT